MNFRVNTLTTLECIPVGCVPPCSSSRPGGGGGSPPGTPLDQAPTRPGTPSDQAPPWTRHPPKPGTQQEQPPRTEFLTHASENITLPQIEGGNNNKTISFQKKDVLVKWREATFLRHLFIMGGGGEGAVSDHPIFEAVAFPITISF